VKQASIRLAPYRRICTPGSVEGAVGLGAHISRFCVPAPLHPDRREAQVTVMVCVLATAWLLPGTA